MSGPASNTTKSAVDQRYLQYEPAIDATSKGCVMLTIVVFDLAWQRRSRCDYLESQPWSGPFVGGMGRFIAFDRPRAGDRRASHQLGSFEEESTPPCHLGTGRQRIGPEAPFPMTALAARWLAPRPSELVPLHMRMSTGISGIHGYPRAVPTCVALRDGYQSS